MLLSEVFWEFFSEEFIEMLSGKCKFLCSAYHEREVRKIYDTLKVWHLVRVYLLCHHISHEQQFGVTVVHDVVYLLWNKLMEHRNSNCPICHGGEESHSPMAHVSSADSDLITWFYSTILKEDVHLLYLSCYVLIL